MKEIAITIGICIISFVFLGCTTRYTFAPEDRILMENAIKASRNSQDTLDRVSAEAGRAESAAEKASGEADRAGAEADRAERAANRAESAADRAESAADRAESAAEKAVKAFEMMQRK